MQNLIVTNLDGVVDVQYSVFPAGEEYVKILTKTIGTSVQVEFLAADSQTIMKGCLVADAIKGINPNCKVIAKFNYFPYGRQDRVCSKGESFSLKFFIEMLKLRFDIFDIIDPHSEETTKILSPLNNTFNEMSNCTVRDPFNENYIDVDEKNNKSKQLFEFFEKYEEIIVVSPDAGAVERSRSFIGYIQENSNIKVNDTLTIANKTRCDGKINISLNSPEHIQNANGPIVIYDDICDGGGTFLALASELEKIIPNIKIILIFSHGIFSKGLTVFDAGLFENIFVMDNNFNKRVLSNL